MVHVRTEDNRCKKIQKVNQKIATHHICASKCTGESFPRFKRAFYVWYHINDHTTSVIGVRTTYI
jgi:hypothetical protein